MQCFQIHNATMKTYEQTKQHVFTVKHVAFIKLVPFQTINLVLSVASTVAHRVARIVEPVRVVVLVFLVQHFLGVVQHLNAQRFASPQRIVFENVL